jgi:hypothetical protein
LEINNRFRNPLTDLLTRAAMACGIVLVYDGLPDRLARGLLIALLAVVAVAVGWVLLDVARRGAWNELRRGQHEETAATARVPPWLWPALARAGFPLLVLGLLAGIMALVVWG